MPYLFCIMVAGIRERNYIFRCIVMGQLGKAWDIKGDLLPKVEQEVSARGPSGLGRT